MPAAPTAAYSLTIFFRISDADDLIDTVMTAVEHAGGEVTCFAKARWPAPCTLTLNARDLAHEHALVAAVTAVPGVDITEVLDRTFVMHEGGKIVVNGKSRLKTRADLAMAYTPGVARVCMAIHDDPMRAHHLTIKRNTVAVVSDGTAVLGLGDIGPEAAMPVMEGKALLFKEFGNVDAFPICLNTKDPDAIVAIVTALAPTFGGINLEDISAPRCFDIEERLKATLDIPVFHDDQHGTAIVVLAALFNALKLVNKRAEDLKVVVSGVGAAGVACSKILMAAGVSNIIGCDRSGPIYQGRVENMNSMKAWYAAHTNPHGLRGTLADAMEGADLFLGLSGPGTLSVTDVQRMAPNAIIFAMANPTPEIMPEEALPHVAVMATGRSDYPNQINNVLAFPGLFRGTLDCRASTINEQMKLAAARAIADVVSAEDLAPDYIIPSCFDERVSPAVAKAVRAAAIATGVARLAGGEVPTFDELTR
jgi:malate dehydrogenase (oxaloacetate-decarboxylating)